MIAVVSGAGSSAAFYAGRPWPPRAKLRAVFSSRDSFDPSASDAEVARAVADGVGASAEAVLVERFRRRVVLYGLRHLGDEARADDLAQEVMATTIARLRAGEVREPEHIGSFILSTARWMAHDVHRRERRAREVAEAAASETDVIAPPPELLDSERLAEALATLSERERAVVVLTFVDDLSAPQIGETLGVEPGHVRVMRHRAIARLASSFFEQEVAS